MFQYVNPYGKVQNCSTGSVLKPFPKIIIIITNVSIYPVWVSGLRTDPLHLLAGCRKRRLNQAPSTSVASSDYWWWTGVKERTFGRGAPCGNPSIRTQLFAADRRTSHGSKKNETLRCPTEEPEETRKSKCCPTGRRRTGILRRPQWRIVHWDWCWYWG